MPQDPLTDALMQRAQAQDPPLKGLQQPFEKGMDFVTSALGMRGQKPGDLPTGLGTLFGMFGPGVASKLGGLSKGEQLLEDIFAANPAAKEAYEKAMATQLPEMMAKKQTAYIDRLKNHDALMDLQRGNPRLVPTETGMSYAVPQEPSIKTPSKPTIFPSGVGDFVTKFSGGR